MTKEKEFLENHEAQSSPVDSFVASVVGESYNPDVLSCLANLSNDEVFTPPNVVNQILDALPQELFRSPDTTFLDPVCKSGVFLREIAKRLILGLQDVIPDLRERLDHIYKKQLFGIAITELTSLVSRRTLYCSMCADSPYSIVRFPTPEGNIRFQTTKHTWVNGKCSICGAAEAEFGDKARRENKENHAYEFIHSEKPEEIFNVKFDVIVGNPPYQLNSDNRVGTQAKPIYNLFIKKAQDLEPNYLSMIIPSRWFTGGIGLNEFRESMLNDTRISQLVDYWNAKDCFPQNTISGGVCYFLWERSYSGPCKFTNYYNGKTNTLTRYLNELPIFIRHNEALTIVKKIRAFKEDDLSSIISPLMPYGLSSNVRGNKNRNSNNDLILHSSDGITYLEKDKVTKGLDSIDKYKILVGILSSGRAGEPTKEGNYRVLPSNTRVIGPGEICTHSYFIIGMFNTKRQAQNALSYVKSKFARFLVQITLSSIHLSKQVFVLVPMQDFTKPWTDAELYAKYQLTPDEIAFIESMIRPME